MNKFNTIPEGIKEISLEEFSKGMFQYMKKKDELRQIFPKIEKQYSLLLFEIHNFDDWEMGFGMKKQGSKTTFVKYGTESQWSEFTTRFAAQFAGDNS